ncbi:substrate-binding periplasmic protein [Agarivorans sp. MS3-6]|uniref:substrate-binding periplasmic protein n=1 Tax=Agarivorans sp. TSD2052 TaxID=2937286 RepID=UPI002010870E|nr:ABC transporter substrate-binding protein [Agarivorans sp. TSD2052]UPW18606.1 ABC transporter substrate-binding protein [Agarivorans sp. TSD2052]
MATLTQCCCGVLLVLSQSLGATPLVFNTYVDPPYVIDGDKGLSGIAIDILMQLKQHSKLDIKVNLLPLKRAYLRAQESPNQCVFPIERTQTRESSFSWISPLFVSRYAIYQRSQQAVPLKSIGNLSSLTIGSYLGSGIGEYLESFSINVDLAKTNLNSAKKLNRLRTDAWASDVLSAAYIQQHFDLGIQVQGFQFYSSLRAIACNKSTEAITLINLQSSLNQLQKSGEINRILRTYERQYQVDLGL